MAIKSFTRGAVAGVAGLALATTGVVAANADVVSDNTIIQPTTEAGITQVNLVGFNDFHGRITKVDAFSAAVLNAADPFGLDNTLLVGNGDQVGASEFESAIQNDDPTMDALLALLPNESFSVGNHEFDKSYADAQRIQQKLGTLLAANVTKDGAPALDAYKVFTINGIRVGVIGAVTQDTPSLVSPDGIAGLEFGDPVAAVNEYAAQLKDGDESNGEADIVIASYHDGGPSNDLMANSDSALFNHLADDTAADVDAIYNGHTHMSYNYDINGRPVIQSASYGDKISQLVFDVDANGKVVKWESSLIDTYVDGAPAYSVDALSADAQARYGTIAQIQADALAAAETLGAEQVGVVNDDITRAYTWADGAATSDTRDQESSLGSLVADSMNEWAKANIEGGSDLSIMNPGGLRADIVGDGVLTYKDAQTVLPFVNNLAIVSLKGADLKTVFEQQWQRDADGNVPSRPYLQLGMSDNVTYTFDSARPEGQRITSITIDGQPLDLEKVYKITMPTFLAAGGDNFRALTNAVDVKDTGWVDLDAFVAYVKSQPGQELKVDTHRNGFEVQNYFQSAGANNWFPDASVVNAGHSHTITVSDLDLRSKGFTANTELTAVVDGIEIGKAEITGDTTKGETTTAAIEITVPTDFASDVYQLELVASPSGSTVLIPLVVAVGGTPAPTETATPTETAEPTETAAAPTVTTDKSEYTVEESKNGIDYAAANFAPGAEYTLVLSDANGEVFTSTGTVEADGTITGNLTLNRYDEATGALVESNLAWVAGTYTLTITAGDQTASTEFVIGEMVDGTVVPTSTEDAGNDQGDFDNKDGLAETGSTENGLALGVGAALVLAAGIVLVARRRVA